MHIFKSSCIKQWKNLLLSCKICVLYSTGSGKHSNLLYILFMLISFQCTSAYWQIPVVALWKRCGKCFLFFFWGGWVGGGIAVWCFGRGFYWVRECLGWFVKPSAFVFFLLWLQNPPPRTLLVCIIVTRIFTSYWHFYHVLLTAIVAQMMLRAELPYSVSDILWLASALREASLQVSLPILNHGFPSLGVTHPVLYK